MVDCWDLVVVLIIYYVGFVSFGFCCYGEGVCVKFV